MKMETIFISIASYRDPLCPMTLISIYEMAKHPERVFIGLCQQNHESFDKNCIFPQNHPLSSIVSNNIRKQQLSYMDAKGPTYARYICAQLYHNEDYFMQIDSHSLMVNEWDAICIRMMKQLNPHQTGKIILSHYPAALEDYNSNSHEIKTITTFIGFIFSLFNNNN
jgi:hypothetical protein